MNAREANRRALLDQVQDCIQRTTDVVSSHNALAVRCGADAEATTASIGALTARLDAQAQWLTRLEASIDAQRSALNAADSWAHERISEVQDDARDFMNGLTFWQRVLWIFTGRRPLGAGIDRVATSDVIDDDGPIDAPKHHWGMS